MEALFHSLLNSINEYPHYTYLFILLGAFFDTLIPVSFFVYGEIVFLVGSVLAWMGELNIYSVAFFSFLWWFLWDNTSFFLWRKYGDKAIRTFSQLPFVGKFFLKEKQEKYKRMFDENAGMILFISRVGWPMAWIMPFIAWSFSFSYKKFLLYNTPWVFLGISFFLSLGYFVGANFSLFRLIFQTYFPIFSLFLFTLLACIIGGKYFFLKAKLKNV